MQRRQSMTSIQALHELTNKTGELIEREMQLMICFTSKSRSGKFLSLMNRM